MRLSPLFAVVVTFLLLATFELALGLPTSPVSVGVIASSSREVSATSNGSVSAQGGNVTQINIDALSVTKAWQGYWGNITGNIRLDDAGNNSFYVWGNATPSGEVYATRNSTIIWASVNCTNDTQIANEETYLGQSPSDGDSVSNTFTGETHPGFYVGNRLISASTCVSTNINVNGSQQNESFYQMLLSDNASNVIYTTIVEPDTYGYSSELSDFQLIVAENEHVGNEGVTPYYFFIELD